MSASVEEAVMPEPEVGSAAPAGSGVGPSAPPTANEPSGANVIDAAADLIRLFVQYVRQETGDLVRDKVVMPTQKAGMVVAFALAAALTLFLGVGFVAVGALILLAQWVGWPGALFIVGGVLLIGAGALTAMKMRSLQR